MALRSEIAGEVPHLRRFALALTGDASLADDLVQDCIEQALRKQHLFDETRKLRSWLFAILRNLYISGLRRNNRGLSASLEIDVASPEKLHEQEAQLVLADVKAAISRLPPFYREVLLLIALEGMSYRGVSEIKGVPVGTVMSRLARARSGLRTLLGENGTGIETGQMTNPKKILDWALHAYADGDLDNGERKLIEKELASDPEARSLVETWQRQKQQISDAFAPVLDEPLPEAIQTALFPPKAHLRMAAALALVLVLGVGAYVLVSLVSAREAERFAENALSAYIVYAFESERPVEIPAKEKNHLDRWLTQRFGRPIIAPDLSARGFAFIGGRLLHDERRPAAQLMYEDRSRRRLTVYVTANTSGREIPFRLREDAHLATCYWLDEDAAYAVVGELLPSELLPLATFVYKAMEEPKQS